jgi:hypothetical protein
MAEGILSLDAGIAFVFSGESESSFVRFLEDARASGGRGPEERDSRQVGAQYQGATGGVLTGKLKIEYTT